MGMTPIVLNTGLRAFREHPGEIEIKKAQYTALISRADRSVNRCASPWAEELNGHGRYTCRTVAIPAGCSSGNRELSAGALSVDERVTGCRNSARGGDIGPLPADVRRWEVGRVSGSLADSDLLLGETWIFRP